jgi:hypothetical protein
LPDFQNLLICQNDDPYAGFYLAVPKKMGIYYLLGWLHRRRKLGRKVHGLMMMLVCTESHGESELRTSMEIKVFSLPVGRILDAIKNGMFGVVGVFLPAYM